MAIDKGMPIEQVQKLLGHVKIDTTMHYAMVNQSNVKTSHRRFIAWANFTLFIFAVQMKLQGKCGVMGMIIDGKIMEI